MKIAKKNGDKIELVSFANYSNDNKSCNKMIIFLHGYGSNGNDLINLSYEMRDSVEECVFLSPNAPYAWEGMGDFSFNCNSFQWFSLLDRDPKRLIKESYDAIEIIKDYIDTQARHFSINYSDITLVGFSQGGFLALQVAISLDQDIAGVVSYSGGILSNSFKVQSKPRDILIIHGDSDDVVPLTMSLEADLFFRKNNIPSTLMIFNGMGHTINTSCIRSTKHFLHSLYNQEFYNNLRFDPEEVSVEKILESFQLNNQ
jgi:phospholipase/carboxylesterase